MLEILFALIVIVFLPVRAWRRHRQKSLPMPPGLYILETALLTGALAGLLWRRSVPLQAIGVQPILTLRFVLDLAICLIAVVGLDALSLRLVTNQIRRGLRIPVPETFGVFADALEEGRAFASFIPVAIMGAIWEELCFRGTVFLLTPRTPVGLALGIVGGSLLFGCQHLRNGVAGLAYSSFYGVLFSCLYLITGDLIAVVVAHLVGNLFVAAYGASRFARVRSEALRQAPMFLG